LPGFDAGEDGDFDSVAGAGDAAGVDAAGFDSDGLPSVDGAALLPDDSPALSEPDREAPAVRWSFLPSLP
jgi:hypothetical protein